MNPKMNKAKKVFLVGLGLLLIATTCFAQVKEPTADPSTAVGWIAQNDHYPWEPTKGYTAQNRYLYYPVPQVYFDTQRELYFFRTDRGEWIKSPTLPMNLRQRLGEFVILKMDTNEPYQFQSEVVRYYPPSHPVKQSEVVKARRVEAPAPPVEKRRSTVIVTGESPPVKPAKVGRETEKSLSPWVPRGSEPSYRYYYYPDSFVYYDRDRNLYYYRSDNQWIQSDLLPGYIVDNIGSPVSLIMKTDMPYMYHSEVIKKYPHPGYNTNVQKIIKIQRYKTYE